jgi:hypothetical protein
MGGAKTLLETGGVGERDTEREENEMARERRAKRYQKRQRDISILAKWEGY